MPTPSRERPRRVRTFGHRFGCPTALVYVAVVVWSAVFAFQRPWPGIPLVVVLVAGGIALLRYSAQREREDQARELARLRAVAPPRGDAWRKLLTHEGLGDLVSALAAQARPALRMETRPATGDLALGRSRIGGVPDLPPDVAWPEHDGIPMMFLAQLDLAEVREHLADERLPAAGHLWFFYSLAQPWGFSPEHAGASRVIHRPAGARLAPATPPDLLPGAARFPACELELVAYEDVPEVDEIADPIDQDAAERYVGVRSYLSGSEESGAHKLLGYPDVVQNPMEVECQLVTNGIDCGSAKGYASPEAKALEDGASEWRLLLQLDSDARAGMMWGDAGRLYHWIREPDLRAHRFENAWLILQCH